MARHVVLTKPDTTTRLLTFSHYSSSLFSAHWVNTINILLGYAGNVTTNNAAVACSFPIVARRFPGLPIPRHFLFFSRHFGTGVLIATAFVHLLPTAFNSLLNSCLPPFWTHGYPAMAGFIAMLSVFLVVTVEMFFASQGAAHVHSKDYNELIGGVPAKDNWKESERRDREDYITLSNQDQGMPFFSCKDCLVGSTGLTIHSSDRKSHSISDIYKPKCFCK